MNTIIKSDRPIQAYTQEQLDVGEYSYTFRLDVDSVETTMAWVMHDDFNTELSTFNSVVTNPTSYIGANTILMNDLLNYNIPYFRSDEADIDQVYYFLWAIHLMYYRHVGADQEVHYNVPSKRKTSVDGDDKHDDDDDQHHQHLVVVQPQVVVDVPVSDAHYGDAQTQNDDTQNRHNHPF